MRMPEPQPPVGPEPTPPARGAGHADRSAGARPGHARRARSPRRRSAAAGGAGARAGRLAPTGNPSGRRIRSFPVMSSPELTPSASEEELLRRYAAGDVSAREELARSYMPLARRLAGRYRHTR